MKKLLLAVAVALLLGVSQAYAVPVTINVDELYDWGRLYSFDGSYHTLNSNPSYFGVGGDTPVGTNVPANTQGIADGQEDTWGIGSIASIKTFPGDDPIFMRSASQELTLMFYGFDDNFLSSPDPVGGTTILGKGGHISVYLDTTPEFNGQTGTAGRTGQSSYTGATEGLLVLDLVPVVLNGSNNTLRSNFDFLTNSGSGAMYLAVSGAGAWDPLYDTNTQLFGSDFSLTFTARNNIGTNPAIADWVVRGDAGGEGDIIPEPASMILVGIGLVGAALRKRMG